MPPDGLDRALLRLLVTQPRVGIREYARLLGIARGTVQSRIRRLEDSGVVTGYAATISTKALGFGVLAFVHLHLAQGSLDAVTAGLARVPEVLEAHSITGEGDVLCRVAAHDHGHFEQVIQTIIALPGVVRTRTEIVLNERVPPRVLPLLDQEPARHEPTR